VRGEDVVARVGGDEFVVVLVSVRDEDDVRTVVAQIRDRASTPVVLHPLAARLRGRRVSVPVS
jgi:GGDEF domain-containing protein